MANLKIKVILASTRDGRMGEKVANWVTEQADKNSELDVELLDLKSFELPFYHDANLPGMMGGIYPEASVTKWSQKISEGDGFIIVTPEYNHGYPAPLKNALDWLYYEWKDKPAMLTSYSTTPGGGIRAAEQLRPVLANVGLIVPSIGLVFPRLSPDGPFDGSASEAQAAKMTAELVRLTKLFQSAREVAHAAA